MRTLRDPFTWLFLLAVALCLAACGSPPRTRRLPSGVDPRVDPTDVSGYPGGYAVRVDSPTGTRWGYGPTPTAAARHAGVVR